MTVCTEGFHKILIEQLILINITLCHCSVAVIKTAELPSSKQELRFGAGSNSVCDLSQIRDGEDLCQWSLLEIRLNTFRWSTTPQKQFIIIIMMIIKILKFSNFSLYCNADSLFYFEYGLWKL